MTGIFLVDDHEVVRHGISDVLDAQPGLEVVGEASTCGEAKGRIAATLPDVAVLDMHLPDGSGIDLCRHIRQEHPSVRCLILTAFDDDDAVLAAAMADASGYLLKTLRIMDLAAAVRAVADGRTLLDPSMAKRATQQMRTVQDEDPRFGSLSLRERQILALIADALTNRQIGDRLGLAEKTVKNYVSTMLSKLGFEHRTQAAVFELERTGTAR
ncbi:two-component system regulatory protein [Leifsonia xyli subsp. cynodontis DSM 46306]|uniref:DNA-binding response regulator n=1 Tax=Leifsonia xyli subsp. cynodontis DSM 46306 TaxID=1389489 RepID=U3P443_LEIXC|nr:response regulator transcription factor [Leifsonia xyli]AGW41080.1 two-component system regulatory protein [Leifsonia xyli subsp. cynodontis DSM 46306]